MSTESNTAKAGGAYRNPSCRRNNARFVPLLQNRIAYDNVAIVAGWPRMKQPPKYILLRPYFSAFMYLFAISMRSSDAVGMGRTLFVRCYLTQRTADSC